MNTSHNQQDYEYYLQSGLALINDHKFAPAIIAFDNAINADDQQAIAYQYRGATEFASGNVAAAIENYN